MAADKPQLGYWKIRGLAQPVRMLLNFCGVDFEDVQYEMQKNEGKWDKSCWFDIKETLGMQYPNLPYFIDGDLKITQSNAVLTYCAEKYGLHDGFTAEEKGRALMHAEQVMDLRNGAVRLFYGTYDTGLEKYVESVKSTLRRFHGALGENIYLLGNKLCGADFHLAEMIYQHRLLDSSIFVDMNELVMYQERIFNLQNVNKRVQDLPCNNKHAKWGGEYIAPGGAGTKRVEANQDSPAKRQKIEE